MNTTSELDTNKVDIMRERFIESMRGTPPPKSTDGSSDISIRDYFAAAALQGLMAYYGGFCDQDAKAAYAAADAMLKAKEAKP